MDTGLQRIRSELKSHLIVAFTSGTVTDRIGVSLGGNLYQSLCDQRASNGCAKKIFTLVHRIGSEHWEHEVTYKFFTQIFDINFIHA